MKYIPISKKSRQARQDLKLRSKFYSQFIKKNDLCFDIGANYGNRIDSFIAQQARVVAVEPQEPCCNFLKKKYGNKIEVVQMGVGSKKGIAELHLSNASTISSFSLDWINSVKEDRFKEYTWENKVSIEMTTLDCLIKKYGIPTFIKIDVEGFELEVLKGLSHPIKMLSFEYTVPEQTKNAIDGVKLIQQQNPNVSYNFSIGESMNLFFDNWKSPDEIIEYIKTTEFQNTLFGDIYCRTTF